MWSRFGAFEWTMVAIVVLGVAAAAAVIGFKL
jgi:hypothetical protein